MLLDSASAKALFAIVLANTKGAETLNRQLPLQVTDRGASWLVTGTPFTDEARGIRFSMCDMFFDKRSAEILGIECQGRLIPSEKEKILWSKIMTPVQYADAFTPPNHFEPNGIHQMWQVAYGGLIPSPSAAIDYAVVVMQTESAWIDVDPKDLSATERDNVWHIAGRHGGTRYFIMLSKLTGKILSNRH